MNHVDQRREPDRRGVLSLRTLVWLAPPLTLALAVACMLGPMTQRIRPHDNAAIVVFMMFGILAGSVTVAGIVCLMTFLPTSLRMALGFAWLVAIAGCILLGTYTFGDFSRSTAEDDLHASSLLPLATISVQSGYWLMLISGWSIDRRRRRGNGLTIRVMFIGTAIVALACANAKFIASLDRFVMSPAMFPAVLISAGIGAGVSLLGMLIVFATLGRFPLHKSLGTLFAGITALVSAGAFACHHYISFLGARDVVAIAALTIGFLLVPTWFTLALRGAGFRLRRQRRQIAPDSGSLEMSSTSESPE